MDGAGDRALRAVPRRPGGPEQRARARPDPGQRRADRLACARRLPGSGPAPACSTRIRRHKLLGPRHHELSACTRATRSWSPGQPRGTEIDEGAWYVLAAQPGDVFAADPDRLWRHVLRRQDGDMAFLATYPDDPSPTQLGDPDPDVRRSGPDRALSAWGRPPDPDDRRSGPDRVSGGDLGLDAPALIAKTAILSGPPRRTRSMASPSRRSTPESSRTTAAYSRRPRFGRLLQPCPRR